MALPDRTNGHKKLRVLGVDPAVAGATGFGVVELEGGAARSLRFGAFKLHSRAPFSTRLREIHKLIADLVAEFAPDAVAVESVFTALNMRTALKLAEVRGVVLLAAAQAGVPAHSYSPREVKASIAGYGAATKLQMQQMVSVQLGLHERPEPSDAADALAVALCHAHAAIAQARMAVAMAPFGPPPRITVAPRSHSRAARIESHR
ncbi:MAG: crossover junction endodeoxyribonuclease RuvC [Candidatus Acidiferrales bacterium]